MNTDDGWAGAKRRRSKLNVQHVYGILAQLSAECEWDSDYGRVRESCANFEIGPTPVETITCFVGSDVDGVLIETVDLGQRFNEMYGVTFVAAELRPNRVSIDGDAQRDGVYRVEMVFKMDCQPCSFTFCRRQKPDCRRLDVRAYRVRGCVRPYHEVHAGSRVLLV